MYGVLFLQLDALEGCQAEMEVEAAVSCAVSNSQQLLGMCQPPGWLLLSNTASLQASGSAPWRAGCCSFSVNWRGYEAPSASKLTLFLYISFCCVLYACLLQQSTGIAIVLGAVDVWETVLAFDCALCICIATQTLAKTRKKKKKKNSKTNRTIATTKHTRKKKTKTKEKKTHLNNHSELFLSITVFLLGKLIS